MTGSQSPGTLVQNRCNFPDKQFGGEQFMLLKSAKAAVSGNQALMNDNIRVNYQNHSVLGTLPTQHCDEIRHLRSGIG